MTFYDRLSLICEDRGLSVSALCKKIGLNPTTGATWKKRGSLLGMTEKQYRTAFKKCMDRVGIPTTHTPYDCRHTTATMYAEMLEPNTLTEVMRHSTLQMTQHYKHNRAEDIRQQLNLSIKKEQG